jgi:hypothetical protein
MAAPTITIAYNDNAEATPNWTDIAATSTITFTGPDSVDGTMDPITRPAAGVRVADELWIVTTGTDVQSARYTGGGQEVGDFVTDVFTANPTDTNVLGVTVATNPETSPGILRAWDDNNYNTIAEESIAGTANMIESFWRAVETGSNVSEASGAGSIPGAYSSQTANTDTYCLEGTNHQLTFSTACTAGNMNRFLLHLLVPDDASNPVVASRTISLTYHYFYT